MIEADRGTNLWLLSDTVVITTNGTVKGDDACVMGRGCALEAKLAFPGIDHRIGNRSIS